MNRITRKTVLVTGASRGIGKACALLFAERGYHVYLNCNKSIDALNQVKDTIDAMPNCSCQIVQGDVGNPKCVEEMFQIINSASDGLDVLVNNAGIAHIGLLSDMSDEEWYRMINTNLSSVFFCSRAAISHMVSKKKGRIINISSMWGTVGASCEAAYSASKSGVHGLTRALAKELAPSNVQVNAIACGVIDTEMNHLLEPEDRMALAEEIPAGRFGTPEEVAQLVWDLSNAPAYLTGQVIGLDGGYI